jgi:hypothetical protein
MGNNLEEISSKIGKTPYYCYNLAVKSKAQGRFLDCFVKLPKGGVKFE